MTSIRFASRVNAGDLDRALIETVKRLADGDKSEHVLGTILGKVRGVSFRNNPNDPENASIGLLGVFEGAPANPELPVIQAPLCFLPKSVHDMLCAAITEGMELPSSSPARGKPQNRRIDKEVPIKVEVGVRKSSSPIGFEFFTNMLMQADVVDVLADLRGEMTPARQLTHAAEVIQNGKAEVKAKPLASRKKK